MHLRHLVPRPLRRMLPPELKYAAQRMSEDVRPSLSFALNPYRQRQGRRELARCRTVQDYLGFAKRRLGVGSVQQPAEIRGVIDYINAEAPRRLCEIGTEHGGTTLLLSRALPSLETVIGVDLYIKHAPQLRAFKPRGQALHLLRGSSYTSAMVARVERVLDGGKLDVLFIDGDHRYEGVKSDFLLYRHLVREGGLILFHDIVPDRGTRYGEDSVAWAGGVPLVWERLKALYPHREFVQDPEQNGFGIGVLQFSPGVELPREFVESDDDLGAYPHLARVQTC